MPNVLQTVSVTQRLNRPDYTFDAKSQWAKDHFFATRTQKVKTKLCRNQEKRFWFAAKQHYDFRKISLSEP